MKKSIWFFSGLVVLLAFLSWPRTGAKPDHAPPTRKAVAPVALAPAAGVRSQLLSFAAAQQGTLAQPPAASTAAASVAAPARPNADAACAEFDLWAEKFLGHPVAGGSQLDEGRRLAMARRDALAEEIKRNPKKALKHAVSWRWRQELPSEITAYFEEVVSGRARIDVYCAFPLPGKDYREFPGGKMRYVTMANSGRTFSAYAYGRRVSEMSDSNVAIHGIAVGNLLALHEDPARVLDAAETASVMAQNGTQSAAPCVLCGTIPASNGQRRLMDFGGQWLSVCSPSHAAELNGDLVTAQTKARRVSLASQGGGGGNSVWTNPPPVSPAPTFGTRRVLYMRVVFPDDIRVQISETEAKQVMDQANDFYVETSYNKATLVSTITPVLTLPLPKLNYAYEGPGLLMADAAEAALKAGFDPNNYDFLIARHPNVPGFDWAGLGGGGGSSGVVWLQASDAGVTIHELGHVFGLGHANYWETRRPELPANPSGNPFDVDSLVGHDSVVGVGDEIEYGDIFDVMGSGGGEGPVNTNQQLTAFSGQFNAIGKNQLGWLPDTYVTEVTRGGTNRIYVNDTPRLVEGRKYALRVAKDAQREYWVSARGKIVGNHWLTNGVELHWASWQQGTGYSDLLDTTPGSKPGRQDAPIVVGRTYADEESKVFITPIAKSGIGTNAYYDIVVYTGVVSNNVAPVVELRASTNVVRVGGTVTFTATATDPNGDAMSFFWDFGDGTFAPNTPSFTRAFQQAGEYVVRCEVSDMKGGMTSKHVVVSVGSPGTLRISGRVLDTFGQPLQNVRVSNGSLTEAPYNFADDYQWIYTDADGAFTLVNLTNRSYPIGAFLNGYITKPLNFDTPITLADRDAEDVLFQASPRAVVTVQKVKDAVTTTANPGVFKLTRTGDTNTALEAVFLLGGSADAGTDYKDWTTVVAQTNVVPTPFGPSTLVFDFYAVVFPTGIVETNIDITPLPGATNGAEKEVALTLMYPLELIQLIQTNGEGGLLATNTNYVYYSDWELKNINGVDTWFQNYSDYLPAWQGEARLKLKGTPPALPTISILALNPTTTENVNDAGLFTLTRSGPSSEALTVYLSIGGTATPDSDYRALAATVEFPPGATVVNLPVIAREDFYLEGNETVNVTVTSSQGYLVGNGTAAVAIGDNDLPTITLTATDGVASELGKVGTLVVTRQGDMTRDLVVNYLVTGSAVSGRDYRTLPGTITIPAGQPSASITLTPRDNGVRDGGNTVEVFLSDSPTYNIGSPSLGTVFIQDRALPVVNIAATDDAAAEPADTGEFTITRTGDATKELIVLYRAGGTAKVLADYASVGSRVRIPPGASSATVTVVPIADGLREDSESVVLELLASPDYNLGNNYQAGLNISDANAGALPAVGFNFISSSGPESAGENYIAVTVSANPDQDRDVTVVWKITGGTAVQDVDYPLAGATGAVVFPHSGDNGEKGMSNRTRLIALPIIDNKTIQPDRTVVLSLLEPPSYISNWVTTNDITFTNDLGEIVTTNQAVTNQTIVGVPMNAQFDVYKSHTFTILDDDSAIVTIEATDPNAMEQNVKQGLFTLRREGPSNRVQRVRFQVTGSASNGSDFQSIPDTIDIPVGASSVDIPVIPVDDPMQEFMEDVTITLLEAPGGQLGGKSAATVSIIDNDGTIEFSQTAYRVKENVDVAKIPIRRTGDTNGPASVDYTVAAGTAIANVDFVATNGTVAFAAGEALQYVPVTILDDLIVEPEKTVNLVLRNQSGGAPLGGQTTATLTIVDDDTSVEFSKADYRVNENGTNAVITLRRLGVIDKAVRVDFTATNGTATSGVEFVGTNKTVTFGAGATNATVLVRILDNILMETNKTVLLSLATNATLAASVGPQTNAVLEIVDDDCALEFAAAEYRVDEYARVVTLGVHRVGGTVNPVTVDYATTNGTAKAGKNYVTAQGTLSFTGDTNVVADDGSGTVTFLPGETNKTLDVRIIDDNLGQGNQAFSVLLSNARGPARGALPGSTVLGLRTNAVVTIVDDELPGSVDFTFNPGLGADAPVYAVAVQADGKILMGGEFTKVDGVVLNHIARLHEDGYLDSFLNPGAGADGNVHALAVQPDGRVLLGGAFSRVNSAASLRIGRLNADGTIDSGFDPGFGADGIVRALAVTADGKILLGGDFTSVDRISRPGIARLMADGTIDSSFDPGTGVAGSVLSLALQADGKVLVGGTFTSAAGASTPYLARFNSDGSIDKAFNPGAGPDATVRAVALAGDGRILIGGAFTRFNNVARAGIARLNVDGSLDTGFDPGAGANDTVYAVGVQADNKVLLAGAFTEVGGQPRNRYTRLNPNGTVDDGFDIHAGANALVRALVVQSDTAMVIGGDFTTVNGLDRRGIARIHGDEKFVVSKVQFGAASYRVPEDGGQATITVLRSGEINTAISVDFATVGGTATPGLDYQPTNGTLQFLAGQTQKSFSVQVMDDHAATGNKFVNLVLTNVPPGYALNAQLTAVLTIEDKESVLAFSAATYTVTRSTGEATITVTRTGPSTNKVSVDYATQDGTAQQGVDYLAASGTLSFDTGVTKQTFTVPIITNTLATVPKTVLLGLANAVGGAVLGKQSTAVLTIVNEQAAFYSLNITPPLGGTVTPGSGTYPAGSTQTITAIPDRDYRFVGWEGSTNSSANPLVIVMDRNYNLTAKFVPTQVTYTFEPPFQNADLQAPPWANSTTAPWQLESKTSASGQYALRSGVIPDGQDSTIQLQAKTRTGAMTFWLRVSSEANWDFLEFYVNGARVQRWSGEVPWQKFQYNLPPGYNQLAWRYVKDANFSLGDDAAFIDDIYLPLDQPDPTPATPSLAVTSVTDGVLTIQLTGKSGLPYVLQSSPDLTTWTPIATNVLQGTTTYFYDPIGASTPARSYRAYTP